MSTVYFSDTDHMNADGTMTILRCASCKGRLRIRPACSSGYRHVDEDGHLGRTDCDQYPKAMPSRVAIPLEVSA